MLLEQKVKVKWNRSNKEHYEKYGYIFTKYNDEFEVEAKHLPKNSHIYVKVQCDLCKKIINTEYGSFTRSKTYKESNGNFYLCRTCSMRKVKGLSSSEFKQKVYEIVGDEYTVLGEYINSRTKILIKHNICGNQFNITPNQFIKNARCKYCYKHKKDNTNKRNKGSRKNTYDFKSKVYSLVGDEYIVLGEYVDYRSKIKLKHAVCGSEFLITPNWFVRGGRCPKCMKENGRWSSKKDTQQFKKEIEEITDNEYLVLSDYKDSHSKIKFKHVKCGKSFYMTPKHFKRGHRCPRCKESKGERKISKILECLKINYITQKKFPKCKHKNILSFDICINSNLQCILIEFDGEQHFESVRIWGKEKLEITQKRDKIKNQYCIDNNIPLIRIPYWEYDNIEYILKNTLMHFNLIEKDGTYDEFIVKKYLVDENWDHDKYIEMSKNYK